MDTSLLIVVVGGVPSLVMGLIAFLARTAFADIREGQRDLVERFDQLARQVQGHDTATQMGAHRLGTVENELHSVLERLSALERALAAANLPLPRHG